MLKHKKQISLILILVFTFPVIYQQAHVVYHHILSHIHNSCNHHHCSQDKVKTVNLLTSSYSEKTKNEKCAICDYKFTVNQMPVDFQFDNSINSYSELNLKFTEENFGYVFILAKSSRAPPTNALLS
ncbi:MAG: hypothetical protein MI922_09035 [Bacteroidales bacterium]|nr:hypothetical protein [Bacteroidales bacterium]